VGDLLLSNPALPPQVCNHICNHICNHLLLSNPALPPQAGALGALLAGGGLAASGVAPSAGYFLNATAWGLATALDLYASRSRLTYDLGEGDL
jgi:hypothetical protein